MLKIRDDIDLKELEKYGFNLIEKSETNCIEHYEQKINGNWWDLRIVNTDDRLLNHYTEEVGYWAFIDDDDLLALAFDDLIKDGLVEKVEE